VTYNRYIDDFIDDIKGVIDDYDESIPETYADLFENLLNLLVEIQELRRKQ